MPERFQFGRRVRCAGGYAAFVPDPLPPPLRLVREVHERLMKGVRGEATGPGRFRRSQNWIGRPGATITSATYIPPPPDRLMECLGAWEKFLHDTSLPPLIQIGVAHSQFEAIHPFLDGNGRVGRLLIILFLIERNILPAPLLYVSAYFEASRDEYYDRLLGVTARGEWEAWLEYFLTGVARQADDAMSRAQRINELLAAWRQRVARLTARLALEVIDLLAENPFCTATRMAKRLDVAFT